MVRVDGLRAHPRNYNRHGAGQVADIGASLTRFGQRKPITTWRGMILTGHGVVEAAPGASTGSATGTGDGG